MSAKTVLKKLQGILGDGLALKLCLGFAVGAGTRVLMLGMHVSVGRSLGLAGYGTFAFMIGTLTLLGVIGSVGWGEVIPRFISQYHVNREWSLLRGVIFVGNRIVFSVTMFFGTILVLLGVFIFNDAIIRSCLVVIGFGLPIATTRQYRFRQLQGVNKTRSGMLLAQGLAPAAVAVFGFTIGFATPQVVLMVYIQVSLLAVGIMTWILFRSLPAELWSAKPEYKTREWQRIATPTILGRSAEIATRYTDILMITTWLGLEAVGLYSSAFRLSFALQTIPVIIGNIVQPMFARAWYDGRVDEVRRVFYGSMLASAICAIPTAMILLIFRTEILEWFGNEFQAGTALLVVFVAGQLINAITGPVAPLLIMTGNERTYGKSIATFSCFNFIGNLICIPLFGVMGAAIVTAVTVTALNLWQLRIGLRLLNERQNVIEPIDVSQSFISA